MIAQQLPAQYFHMDKLQPVLVLLQFALRHIYRGTHNAIAFARESNIPVKYVTNVSPDGTVSRDLVMGHGCVYLLTKPFFDSRGEQLGPVFTYYDFLVVMQRVKDDAFLLGRQTHEQIQLKMKTYLKETGKVYLQDVEFDEIANVHLTRCKKAQNRSRQRTWKLKTNSAKWKAKKLSMAIKAIDMLKDVADNPRVTEKLHYEINNRFLDEKTSWNVANTPCLVLKHPHAKRVLGSYLLCPAKMTKGNKLIELAEELSSST